MSQLLSTVLGTLYCFVLITLGVLTKPLDANAAEELPPGVGSREIWLGADADPHNWLVYSGGTYAPWSDIHQDGIRIRATTGYGHYDYQWDKNTKIQASKTYADALLGYQKRFGDLTAKAFAGWAILNDMDVPAANVRKARFQTGFKAALELWLNLGSQAWTSLDVSYADTRETANLRSRLGYRVLPTVSAGVEAILNRSNLEGQVQANPMTDSLAGNARLGAFLRYEWFGGEISASGGVSGDIRENLDDTDLLRKPQPYGTINWIAQF